MTVTTNYTVSTVFPNGVLIGQLQVEMVAVWPGDLFPISFTSNGSPGTGGVITTGQLTVETQRALTIDEADDAIAHFLTHDPVIGAQGGVMVSDLIAGVFNGQTIYVIDESRQGAGMGVLCYWDGSTRKWMRIRDDNDVATIP